MTEHRQAETGHVLVSRNQTHTRHGSGNCHIFTHKSMKLHGIRLLSWFVVALASVGHGQSILAHQKALIRRAVTDKLGFCA